MTDASQTPPVLSVRDLVVEIPTRHGILRPVDGVSWDIHAGEILGVVGESGAGKSMTGNAVIGLLDRPARIASGEVLLNGQPVHSLRGEALRRLRGKRMGMIFQDPLTSLNPLMTIEDQLIETMQAHEDLSRGAARARAIDLLEEIGIRDAASRITAYPHQFSGGMRQRVVIALALCTNPELIIADEPTTALDVAVQSQVLALIRQLADERQIGFILITHDIGVIAQITDQVTVLRGGRVMETGKTARVLTTPEHPYTRALLAAVPRLDRKLERFLVPDVEGEAAPSGTDAGEHAERWLLSSDVTEGADLELAGISVHFAGQRTSLFRKPPRFTALDNVSLRVRTGSVTGLVGESGSGKSTLAKVITGLIEPGSGAMRLRGESLPSARSRSRRHSSRRLIQMIFQDPYSSLNSRHRIGSLLAEPLWLYGLETDPGRRRVLCASMLALVGLAPDAIEKYPHQFSGGQRQRIAVARVLLARPKFLICDEPTSALDVSIQAQILNLLKELQRRFGLTMLFISHNLAVVRQVSDDIVVLKDGKVLESGGSEAFFTNPKTTYSQELLRLTPTLV